MSLFLPPPTKRHNVTETVHGVEITDPYRWLEDQDSFETRAWLNLQMEYTHQVLAEYGGKADIKDRLSAMMKVDASTVPAERDGWYYFMRRGADEQQHVIFRRHRSGQVSTGTVVEEVLINPNKMGADSMVSAGLYDVSEDGSLMIYSLRSGGADEVSIHLFDTNNKIELPDTLPAGRYFGVIISADKSKLYYSKFTPEGPRVCVHEIGTDVSTDVVLFGGHLTAEKLVGITISDCRKYLVMAVYYGSAGTKSDVYVLDLETRSAPQTIVDTIEARFSAEIVGDQILMHTTWNAPNGRLFSLPIGSAPNNPEDWTEIVPMRENGILESFSAIGGKIYLRYLQNVSSIVEICSATGEMLGELALPGIGTVGGPYGSWNKTEAFYAFSSFAAPTSIYRFDTSSSGSGTTNTELWSTTRIPVNTDNIIVRQVYYTSKDGTQVPMFLVHAKDINMDGNRPVYLTGYGGFNLSRTPVFTPTAALWAERGGVYALPNLRGGGEFGEDWHHAGMLDKKQNVFDDFYAAAQYLIDEGYTCPAKIGISGRSNGGLLVGAAVTQRPELFGAAICGYPLLDMIRYHQFLVAGYWVPEYGSSEDANQFKTLLAYSPYHHVSASAKYPPIMFVTGDSDTRVAPLHARKMAALMQAGTEGINSGTTLLHYDVKSGHSDGKPIDLTIDDLADELLFLYSNLH